MNRENTERLMAYKRKKAMEKAKKDTENNPINSYTHGFADGYSKGFSDALVVRAQDKEFWDKVAKELKPTIKRALEETFEPTKCMNEFVKEEENANNKT